MVEEKPNKKLSTRDAIDGFAQSFLFVILGTFVIGAAQAWIIQDIAIMYQIPIIRELEFRSIYGAMIILRFVLPDSLFRSFGDPINWMISLIIISGLFWCVAKVFSMFWW
jgi:hypothetical protein